MVRRVPGEFTAFDARKFGSDQQYGHPSHASCITLGLTILRARKENIAAFQWLPLADRGDSNSLAGATSRPPVWEGSAAAGIQYQNLHESSFRGKIENSFEGNCLILNSGLALKFGVDWYQIVGAAYLNAMARIINNGPIGGRREFAERPKRFEQSGSRQILLFAYFRKTYPPQRFSDLATIIAGIP